MKSTQSKLKITDELFSQLKKWETKNIEVTDKFKEELKKLKYIVAS